MPTATEQPAKLARLTIVDVTADDDDRGEPMTAAIALVATPQVTLGSVIELLAYLEGVALVMCNLGVEVDPIRLAQWQFQSTTRGATPWDPGRGSFVEHLKAGAWALLSKRVDAIAVRSAMATGHGLDVLKLSTAQVGTLAGVVEAARRLAEVMPFVRAHDMTYVGIAGVLRDWMRCALARIVAAPTDGTVERMLKGKETGPQPGCDGVTDAAL